jgi:YggT family protein
VVLSWINPGAHNPATSLIYSITEPVLMPARKMLPPMSGLDLSPLLVMMGIQLAKMLIIPPILALA